MPSVGTMFIGVIALLLAISGLFLASAAHDQAFYSIGLGFFVFGVGFVFVLIKQTFDLAEKR